MLKQRQRQTPSRTIDLPFIDSLPKSKLVANWDRSKPGASLQCPEWVTHVFNLVFQVGRLGH